MYSGYGIAYNGKSSWSFGNDYESKFVIFGVDTSSSFHIDNRKIKFFFILGEGDTLGINGSFGAPENAYYLF